MEITKDELERAKEDLGFEDDLEDFDLIEEPVHYEIWLLGDNENYEATDFEFMIDGGYTDITEANKCFEYFSEVEHLAELQNLKIPEEVGHLYIRIEEVISDGECVELYDEKEITNFKK